MADPTETQVLEYEQMARALLPQGKLWTRRPGSTMHLALLGLATEFARAGVRTAEALRENDPSQTIEVVQDWETELGLPFPCDEIEPTLALRRAAIVSKLTAPGGQSAASLIARAAKLGFTITIEEHQAFKVGGTLLAASTTGQRLTNGAAGWPFVFTVHAPEQTPSFFSAGQSLAGDSLVGASNELLECHIDQAKPAHTHALYAYDQIFLGFAPWRTLRPPPAVLNLSANIASAVVSIT
jgi:uncharacterized protein YmfQ (DUF2313 family)